MGKQTVHSVQFYETEGKKRQFLFDSFQLDTKEILNGDAKLKEAVIKLFLDNLKVLATNPTQYGETEVLEMKVDLVPGAIPYKSQVRPLNPDQKDNLCDQIDEWLEQGGIDPFNKYPRDPPQSARCYSVLLSGRLWCLSWQHRVYGIY